MAGSSVLVGRRSVQFTVSPFKKRSPSNLTRSLNELPFFHHALGNYIFLRLKHLVNRLERDPPTGLIYFRPGRCA